MNISIIQSGLAWENPEKNFRMFEKKIGEVASGADIVVLPEMFTTGFSMNPDGIAPLHGVDTSDWMRSIAVEYKTAITGSYVAGQNGCYYNRMIFASPDGGLEYYDKRHLFRMADEDGHYTAGSRRVVVRYRGWRILLLICYDLRFPVWSRNRNDYDLMVLVANFPERRQYAWNTLLPARAIENQCYVAACNRVGADGNGIAHAGDSQIIDPMGKIIALAKPNSEETISAPVSLGYLKSVRDSFPAHLDADNFDIR